MLRRRERWLTAALTVLIVTLSTPVSAAQRPNFSGKWIMDRSRCDPASKTPWGHNSANPLLIYQTATSLTLSLDKRVYRFLLDGVPHSHIDTSMGKLPHFVRLIETQATWNRAKLVLKITEVARITDPTSGRVRIHPGITRVHILTLSRNGTVLTMERTGYRDDPPDRLHGRPYSRVTDRAYVHQTLIFSKVSS